MASLKVRGVPGVLKALETFDKDLAKATAKEISRAGKSIASEAKSSIPSNPPLRNWRNVPPRIPRGSRMPDGSYSNMRTAGGAVIATRGGKGWPPWSSADAKTSIKSRRKDVTLTVVLNEASANIFAIAGTKGPGDSPQGRAFVQYLPPLSTSEGRGGRKGRIMVPAVRKEYPKIIEIISQEILQVVREVNRKV